MRLPRAWDSLYMYTNKYGANMEKDKHKLILEAACAAFTVNGYEKSSIEKISKMAGVAQGLARYYFSTKENLYFEALCMVMRGLKERVALDLDPLDGPADAIAREFVRSYMAFTSDPATWYAMVYQEPPFTMIRNAGEMERLGNLSLAVVKTLARKLDPIMGTQALRVATYVVTSLHGVQRARFSPLYRDIVDSGDLADFFAGAVSLAFPPCQARSDASSEVDLRTEQMRTA